MSSTSRGGDRHASDFYRTPRWCSRRFLEANRFSVSHGINILEPSAGDGAVVRAFAEHGYYSIVNWTLVEIRPEEKEGLKAFSSEVYSRDFLACAAEWEDVRRHFDAVITNPPFPLAFEMLKASLKISPRVTFLLRLNWLESEERVPFLREHMPDVFVLPNRPVFTLNADGKAATDSIPYAWMMFQGAQNPGEQIPLRKEGSLSILGSTSQKDRRIEIEELIVEQRLLKRKGD